MIDKELDFQDLEIDLSDFPDLTRQSNDNPLLVCELQEVIAEAYLWVNPKVCFAIFDQIELFSDKLQISNLLFDCKRKIAFQLSNAEKIAVFVCTIGDGFAYEYNKYKQTGDFLKNYYVDSVGSISVEKAMDIFQQQFADEMNLQGYGISNRYSPGYCGWSVGEQQKLFSLLPDKPCEVTLTESSLMHPIKSISGIIGIGTNVRQAAHACHICEMTHCLYGQRKRNHESKNNIL